MHVLHVGKFYPPDYLGGVETFVATLSAALVRRGVDVECVVAAVRGRGSVTTQDGVRVTRLASLGVLYSQPLALGLLRALRTGAADVVHVHHPNPLADAAVLLSDRRPLLVSHHSDVVRQRGLLPLYAPVVGRVLRRARAVVVSAPQLIETCRELAGVEGKVRVIPYGIDPAAFAATPAVEARARALRSAWGARPAVLGVGRLVGYKGWDVLLRATRDLDATVVLVGAGPEEARLRALAAPNVVFAGRVPDELRAAYYHAADLFCLPAVSVAEAFGIVLLEAMACGKPLVTTALPTGVSAVNRAGITGLVVPPGDVGALRDAVAALLGDADTRHAMGRAARAVLEREYTAALMAERYLMLYREAMA